MSTFIFNKNTIEEIKTILSVDRYLTYYQLAEGDDEKALKLYKTNIGCSQKFYTILHVLEICLRNKIDGVLKKQFGEHWIMDNCLPLTQSQRKTIQDSRNTCSKENLVPSLQFGFWTSFFGRSYEELWRHHIRGIFVSEKLRRGDIASSLKMLRELRNRIAHHEPIIHQNISSCEHKAMWLIQMMSPITREWLQNDLLDGKV